MSTATPPAPPKNTLAGRDDIGDKPIVYRPFMGKSDVTLTANTVLALIAKPTRLGKMPSVAQCIRFAKLCEARGLDPWEGDAYLVGYDAKDGPEFSLITAHQAFLKRAETHPEYDGMESGVVVASADGTITDQPGDFLYNEQTLAGGWARVHFKNRSIPTYRRLNLDTFSTGRSRWEKDPAGMIVKCAEADALRSSFPNSLGGMYLREEFDATIENVPRAPVPMPKALAVAPPKQVDPPPVKASDPVSEPGDEQAGTDGTDAQTTPELTLGDDPIEAELIKFCVAKAPAGMEPAAATAAVKGAIKLLPKPWSKVPDDIRVEVVTKARAGQWPVWPEGGE